MELWLLKAVGLIRPVASTSYGQSFFDAVAIVLFGIIIVSFLAVSATRKSLNLTTVDFAIFAFVVWCLTCAVTYFEETRFRELAKLLVPLLSYTVVKNVVTDARQYRSLLFWIILGFSILAILSAALMVQGQGLSYVSYWTGVARWQGAYTGSHSMGHSMALFLFVLAIYYAGVQNMSKEPDQDGKARAISRIQTAGLLALGAIALYCLYMSQVRSAILGVLVFFSVYLFYFNRRALVLTGIGLTIIASATLPYWLPALLPEVVLLEKGKMEMVEIGSGRPLYWRHNLDLFLERPLDEKLAGAGIGYRAESMHASQDEALDSHNDWLDLLLQTGLVGVVLFAAIQVLVLRAIWRMQGRLRFAFLALFLAVNVMMFVSNSYIWRIQVSHLYYIILAFVEVRRRTADSTSEQYVTTQRLSASSRT